MFINPELEVPNLFELPEIGEKFVQARELKSDIRARHNELGRIISLESQETHIYANPEIFELFCYLEEHGNSGEFDVLAQIIDELNVPVGTRAYVAGSGWGLWARELSTHRSDLKITNIDINPKIVKMDSDRNRRLGLSNIKSIVGDATKIHEFEQDATNGPPNFFTTVGLMRYLNTQQREETLDSVWKAMKTGDFAVIREVNYLSMRDCTRILEEHGISYETQVRQAPHLKYTTIFFYYYMYNKIAPVPETLKKDGFNFDLDDFKEAVDKARGYYPDFGYTTDDGKYVDLRHLLVLTDLAGKEEKSEYIVMFTKTGKKEGN